MTQEEKAKAYDKALEQAKKELNTCGSMDCDAARQIFRFFPELRESDDERIRKAIGAAICGATAKSILEANGTNLPDALAYLEKQKEQHPIDVRERPFQGIVEDKLNYIVPSWYNGEQKPAEWNEDDELMRKRCIVDLGYLTEYEPQYKERYDAQISWLKSLRPSWKPSEEQMGAIRTAIDVLRGQVYDGKELYPGTSHVLTMMLNYFQANNNDTKV